MFEQWQKVCVFLTRRCNLRCRGCNVVNHQSAYELTTDEWKKAFNIMKDRRVGFVVLFGGEPTLRDDLPELVKHLNKIRLPHTIITNGIRLMGDSKFYRRLLDSKPYSISASVNSLIPDETIFSDQKKSEVGQKLLLALHEDVPNMDLVANMAVTRENIRVLPNMVSYFTDLNIWSILSFFHVCSKQEAMYWWYRGPINKDNEDLVFSNLFDDIDIQNTAFWLIDHYDELKLHNQKDYFKVWSTLGITQDWKCSEWACPAVNPDGSLMACIDRPLSKPFSIFDIPHSADEIYQNFKEVISACPGCFWDHMWETNKYAAENAADLGKKNFSHQGDGDT